MWIFIIQRSVCPPELFRSPRLTFEKLEIARKMQKNVCAKTNTTFFFVASEIVCKLNTFPSHNGSLQHIFSRFILKLTTYVMIERTRKGPYRNS